ncbi:hypothetical protein L596_024616 [Steinernema carpocapsae]|uniref:Uncharacterized protein n=1 Tax=Steinernema carpocapsae TaxID=34508 RepID=A0A4U5M590_STECR|nr:hypothetical protein L596_024616 [Steinernema carpocapsae]
MNRLHRKQHGNRPFAGTGDHASHGLRPNHPHALPRLRRSAARDESESRTGIQPRRSAAPLVFSKAQIGDAVFLFPPSQIALAGLKYGLDQLNKSPELLKEYLMKLFRIDLGYAKPEDTVTIDKLMVKLDEVIDYVVTAAMDISEEDRIRIRNKFSAFATLYHDRTRRNQNSASNSHDSDDEESG